MLAPITGPEEGVGGEGSGSQLVVLYPSSHSHWLVSELQFP